MQPSTSVVGHSEPRVSLTDAINLMSGIGASYYLGRPPVFKWSRNPRGK